MRNEIEEACWTGLSPAEQQLFDIERRTQSEINEVKRLKEDWSPGTFEQDARTYEEGVARSILHHANKHGYDDHLEYLRDASTFDKSGAVRTPSDPTKFRNDDTERWENLRTGEFIVVDKEGKIRSYGFNPY